MDDDGDSSGFLHTDTKAPIQMLGESRETEKLLWASRNSELFRDVQRLRYADRLPGFAYKTPASLIPSPIGGQCKCHTPKKSVKSQMHLFKLEKAVFRIII